MAKGLTLKVMMLGGRRAGKTSTLAAMQGCFDKVFRDTVLNIIPEGGTTLEAIEKKQAEIKRYVDGAEQNLMFVPDHNPSSEDQIYRFLLKMQSQKKHDAIHLEFYDYPGEYLIGNHPEYDKIEKHIEDSDVLMIILDTPYLMEEDGIYNVTRNRCDRITSAIKTNFVLQSSVPKMVLFVPIKCEKYYDENRIDEVFSKVESCYEDLIFYLRGHCEMAVTPIFTLGTAVFAGFDYDESSGETIMSKELDGEILPSKPLYRFSPKAKEAAKRQGLAKSYTAEPKYCEQPAVYTIYYALTFASNVAKIMEMKRKQDKKGLKKLFFNPKFSVMVLSFLKTAIPSPLWGIVKPETLGKMVEALQQRYDFPSAEDFLQQRDIVYKRMKRSGDGYYVLEPDIMKFKGDAT